MTAKALWVSGMCAGLMLGAGGCDGGETTSATGGSGGTGASTSTSQGGQGGAGATGGGGSGGSGGSVGGPFTSKGASSYETQTSLAADSKGGVVAAWIALFADNTSGIGYAVSRDGGKTWTPPAVIESPDGRLASNPVVVADSKGVFSLAWLGFRVDGGPDEHIYVSRLNPASETFEAPSVASDDGSATTLDFDKPEMKVDANDALLLTWADFSATGAGGPAALTFARSADGEVFTRSTVTSDATFGNLASLCLDKGLGAAAPLYMVHLGDGGTVTLRTSVNQGQSWELRPTPAAQTVFQDITCVVKGSALWIAYASGTALFSPTEDSPGDAVEVMRSLNGGVSFDAPVKITSGPAAEKYLFPRLLRAPSGQLAVVYYRGEIDGPAELAVTTSAEGTTWSTAAVAPAGTLTIDRTIASWLGAYVGFAIPGEVGLVSYAENTENKAHVRFAEVALP